MQGDFYRSVDGETAEDASPIFIWVRFEGLDRVRILCASNGWGIGLDEAIPEGCDMGSAGSTFIREIATIDPFSSCLKAPLRDAALIRSPGTDEPFGIKLRFDLQAELLILNWGDDFWISDQLPPDATEEEFVLYPVGNN